MFGAVAWQWAGILHRGSQVDAKTVLSTCKWGVFPTLPIITLILPLSQNGLPPELSLSTWNLCRSQSFWYCSFPAFIHSVSPLPISTRTLQLPDWSLSPQITQWFGNLWNIYPLWNPVLRARALVINKSDIIPDISRGSAFGWTHRPCGDRETNHTSM